MRKLLIISGIAFAICYFFWLKNDSTSFLTVSIAGNQTASTSSEVAAAKRVSQDTKKQKNTPVFFSSAIERDVNLDSTPEPTSEERDETKFNNKNTMHFGQEKLPIDLSKELKKATVFTIWKKEETRITGIYQGQALIKGQLFTVRLNLLFSAANNMIQPNSCIAIYNSYEILFKEFYADGQMKIMRMPEKLHFIIAVKNRDYFQLFETSADQKKILVAHVTAKGWPSPIFFRLNSVNGRPDGCE